MIVLRTTADPLVPGKQSNCRGDFMRGCPQRSPARLCSGDAGWEQSARRLTMTSSTARARARSNGNAARGPRIDQFGTSLLRSRLAAMLLAVPNGVSRTAWMHRPKARRRWHGSIASRGDDEVDLTLRRPDVIALCVDEADHRVTCVRGQLAQGVVGQTASCVHVGENPYTHGVANTKTGP